MPHTFALIEGLYGIMNEHQVAMGESTCAAKIFNGPRGFLGSTALLEVSELSQIAVMIVLFGDEWVNADYETKWHEDTIAWHLIAWISALLCM